MGAGILPLASYKGKLYFLFSRETKDIDYKDSGLWSDLEEVQIKVKIFLIQQ